MSQTDSFPPLPQQPNAEAAACPSLNTAPQTRLPIHLAVGMFDGVHLGHQAVIEAACNSARRAGGISAVLSFTPHPSRLFAPERATRLLMPVPIKLRVLRQLGVDLTLIHPFDHAFAAIEADAFPAYLKEKLPTLRSIYVGENFRYGKNRSGDIHSLLAGCRALGIDLFSAERIRCNGEPISSTRIRSALENGAIEVVNSLLGYSYFAEGTVIPGKRLGHTLGFPTLNLPWEPELLPAFGVYAVQVRRSDGDGATFQKAVANYGVRPTVESSEAPIAPLLEIHTLEPTDLTTGDHLSVQWLHFIRPEQKFASLDALCTQIAADTGRARELLA